MYNLLGLPNIKRMNIILADSSNSQPKEVTFPRSNFFIYVKNWKTSKNYQKLSVELN